MKRQRKPQARPVPADLQAILAIERERLLQTRAVLQCLTFALTYGRQVQTEPVCAYADVAAALEAQLNGTLQRLETACSS